MFKSIQTKIMFFFLTIGTCTLVLVSFLLMMSIEQSAKQMEGTAIREQAETMARVVSLENDLGGKELPGEELSKLFPGKEYFLLDEEEAVEIYKVNEQGKPISRDIYKEGKDYICGIAKIEGAETYLVVQKTYEEAYGEVNRMKTVAIAFTVLAIIGLWCIGKRISFIIQKPIKDLALTVKQIAAGDISQGVQVNSNDELAEIAVAFNKMLDHLKLTMKQVLDKSGEAASMHEIMQYVEQTYDQHAGGVLSIDNIGEITTFNETAELLTGISAKELIGRHISNPIPPEIKGLIDTLRRTLSQGSVNFKKIADIQHINGERIPIVYTANIQFGMKDEVIGAICVFRRIEDIRKFEESALRRKNLGALGEMAASLAHEVKNPLTSIRGYAQYLKLDFSDDSDCPEELNIILHEVDRLTNMLDNFLKFARPEVPKLELVDIRAVSNYVVKLVEKELPKNTKIKKNYKDVPKVMIDPQQFEPVILNLILNAVQAMPEGGTINLNVNYDQERGAVCLEVQDNGVGIPLELLEKIFQPFFTTKKEGTGMGLAICTRIVDAHKGILEIESIEGEMTKVSIRLQTEFAEVKRSE